MTRFTLEVYLAMEMIFCKDFKSITSVAKCIDCFDVNKKYDISFYVHDLLKGEQIDTDELMRIWHS